MDYLELLKKNYEEHPKNLEYCWKYGKALLCEGEVYRSRKVFTDLYYMCQYHRKNVDEKGNYLYPAKEISHYEYEAAYGLCDLRRALNSLDEYEEACRYYKLDEKKEVDTIRSFVGKQIEILNHYREQIVLLERCTELNLQAVSAWLEDYKHFMDLVQKDKEVYYFSRGRVQGMIEVYSAVYNNVMCTFWNIYKSQPEKAKECFEIMQVVTLYALNLSKDSSVVLSNLGTLYSIAGEREKAIECFNKALGMVEYEYTVNRFERDPENEKQVAEYLEASREHIRQRMAMLNR